MLTVNTMILTSPWVMFDYGLLFIGRYNGKGISQTY